MKILTWIQRNWFNVYMPEFMYIFETDLKSELQMPSTYGFPW